MTDKNSIFSNMLWRFAERCGAQFVAFIVSVILARILEPEVYGTIALITIFTAILQVFVDSGLGNALIQKKEADDLDFSTVFYTNILFCTMLYIIICICAPLLSIFYNDASITSLVRVLGLTVFISGIKNVQQAYVSKHMLFRKFFFSTLGGTIISAVIGIILAFTGFGVWALVAQHVINTAVDTLILWTSVKWRPKKQFSFERLKKLYSYGWKLLVSSLIDSIYNNLRQLFIGKIYSSADLAYYNYGDKLPGLVVKNINSSIDSVLLPAMSNEQDSRKHIKDMTRRAIKISVYIMAPVMIGLSVAAVPVVKLLLTDKWLPCVPFLRIFCITYMFYPIHTANLNAIKAMGRSDLFLKLEIMKKIVGLTLLFITIRFGVMAMAYSLLVTSIINQLINSWPNRKLLQYGYLEQLKDMLSYILLALFMAICITFPTLFSLSNMILLLIQIILGAMIYFGLSAFFKIDSFLYLKDILKEVLRKKRN